MAALLTSERANTDEIGQYIGECRDMGIPVHPPDVNESEMWFVPVLREAPSEPRFSQDDPGNETDPSVRGLSEGPRPDRSVGGSLPEPPTERPGEGGGEAESGTDQMPSRPDSAGGARAAAREAIHFGLSAIKNVGEGAVEGSNGVGALISGIVVDLAGYRWMYMIAGLLFASGFVLIWKQWAKLK